MESDIALVYWVSNNDYFPLMIIDPGYIVCYGESLRRGAG